MKSKELITLITKVPKEAAITKAEGEAKAQQLQQQTLTDRLLRKLWIEKWKGDIPRYVGDGGNLFFQIPAQ